MLYGKLEEIAVTIRVFSRAIGARSALLIGTLYLIGACGVDNDPGKSSEALGSDTSDRIPVSRLANTADIPVEFTVASERFVVPTEVLGMGVTYHGQKDVEFVTLGVYFPEFEGRSKASDPGRQNHVQISLQENRQQEPIRVFDRDAAEAWIAWRFSPDRVTELADPESGLIELKRAGVEDSAVYRRADDFRRDIDGRIPFTICYGKEHIYCSGRGYLPPDIEVQYRFSPERLAEWPSIESGVFEAVTRFRQKEN